MKIEEISKGYRYEYEKICPCCEIKHLILTQDADFQEYNTEIYLKCSCGEFIEFILPVN